MASIKRLNNTFRFTGDTLVPKSEEKLYKVAELNKNWNKTTLSLGVKVDDSNGVFANFTAMIPTDENYQMSKPSAEVEDGKRGKVKFAFKDRNSEAIKKQIMDMVLFTVDLEDDFEKKAQREKLRFEIMNLEKKEDLTDADKEKLEQHKKDYAEKSDKIFTFVHELDFINCLKDNIETLKANRIRVHGTYSIQAYNEKYYPQLTPNKLELVSNEKDEESGEYKYKSELLMPTMDFYFDKESLDNSALKDEKKIYVNGYLKGQIKEDDKYIEAYYPQQIIIDCTKLDLENEGIAKLIQFTMGVFKVKGKNLWNMGIKCNLKQGAEEIIFDESCLTDFQRMQIELGRKTLDDYKPRGNVYGKSITEIRFSDFLDKMEQFSEGSVETDVRADEMVVATSKPKVQTVEEVKKEEKEDDESSALAGLFD